MTFAFQSDRRTLQSEAGRFCSVTPLLYWHRCMPLGSRFATLTSPNTGSGNYRQQPWMQNNKLHVSRKFDGSPSSRAIGFIYRARLEPWLNSTMSLLYHLRSSTAASSTTRSMLPSPCNFCGRSIVSQSNLSCDPCPHVCYDNDIPQSPDDIDESPECMDKKALESGPALSSRISSSESPTSCAETTRQELA